MEIFFNHLSATVLEIFWRLKISSQRCQKSPILMTENPNYFVRGFLSAFWRKSDGISSTVKQIKSLRAICLNSSMTLPFHHFVRMSWNLFDANAFPSLHCQKHFLLFNDNIFWISKMSSHLHHFWS